MDQQLINQIINGDKQAFQQLYQQYADPAIRIAIAITRNRDLAKDAVQETFIRVYRNLKQYDPSQAFDPWFYRILTNECNRILKKEGKYSIHSSYQEREFEIPEEEKKDFGDLYEAIQTLKDNYRVPIILKYLKGFSEKEIAEILSLNQNTVKTRLFKGREKLKEALTIQTKRGEQYGY